MRSISRNVVGFMSSCSNCGNSGGNCASCTPCNKSRRHTAITKQEIIDLFGPSVSQPSPIVDPGDDVVFIPGPEPTIIPTIPSPPVETVIVDEPTLTFEPVGDLRYEAEPTYEIVDSTETIVAGFCEKCGRRHIK